LTRDGLRPIVMSTLVVEGDTEEVFYGHLRGLLLNELPIQIKNARTRSDVPKTVLANAIAHKSRNPHEKIRIYCCLDSECPYGILPDFDLQNIKAKCKEENLRNVLSVDAIFAAPMIESWFFYDLDGIYDYLGVDRAKRNPLKKYRYPTKCAKTDLKKLFYKHGSEYHEGKRARGLIHKLDLRLIAMDCPELCDGIELIRSQAGDSTNSLFSA